ncbi:hypothetical protein B296_00015883 [Ensete ventricosum]|uniref:Uncharacterized protein n=1 Tax=Ensete ventricosum TaxID=4639 RepID=A0A426ZMM4_ENSVE|nr:hypothetical protein B296_00015883 [Ensete ventricosum]
MEQHDPALASTRVYVLDLCSKKAPCFRSMFPSSMLIPFMRLGYFTRSYGDHHPLGLFRLTEQSVHYSASVNVFARL